MTDNIALTKDTWVEISSVSVDFQIQGQFPAFITEQASLPAIDTIDKKTALPGKMYTYTKLDGNFYARAVGQNTSISFDPIVGA